MVLPIETSYKIPIDKVIEDLQSAKAIGHTHMVSHLEILGLESVFIIETQRVENEQI